MSESKTTQPTTGAAPAPTTGAAPAKAKVNNVTDLEKEFNERKAALLETCSKVRASKDFHLEGDHGLHFLSLSAKNVTEKKTALNG